MHLSLSAKLGKLPVLFSAPVRDYFSRLDAAGLRVREYDQANARLIDRLVANGGNFWPDSGAFNAMAGYLYPGNGEDLIPLKDGHDAGTLNAFVTGDWNAVTGLKGDGSTKYVDSNRNNNADGQDDQAMGTYVGEIGAGNSIFMAAGGTGAGANNLAASSFLQGHGYARMRSSTFYDMGAPLTAGYFGISRSASTGYNARFNEGNSAITVASQTPTTDNITILLRAADSTYSDARLPFYHIGPNLNGTGELAELDAALTEWKNALAAA